MASDKILRRKLAEDFQKYENLALWYWRKQFIGYTGSNYEEISREDIRCRLSAFLQTLEGVEVTNHLVNDVLTNLVGQVHLESNIELPVFLDEQKGFVPSNHLIAMNNGTLDLERLLSGQAEPLLEKTFKLISLSSLPYDFHPEADCPRWLQFLEEIQPEPEVRDLLQEWFGYNMVYDTTYGKFALFVGEGANGKSVCCVVLRELVGLKNVSAVGLEAFDPRRTFPLAVTIGKLANIVEELSEINKPSEGLLKQYVTGGVMTIERKGVDAYSVVPTARITFATNVLPRFGDRSSGLWRRMLYIPFNYQVLDESKQDKRLADPLFWRVSGELSGIFNWALAGLIRLRQNGHFTEPKSCLEARAVYQKESNPAQSFLYDYCEFSKGFEVFLRDVYYKYKEHILANGHKPLSSALFAKEIPKVFPHVTKTENSRRMPSGNRSPIYYGLKFKDQAAGFGIVDSDGMDSSYLNSSGIRKEAV